MPQAPASATSCRPTAAGRTSPATWSSSAASAAAACLAPEPWLATKPLLPWLIAGIMFTIGVMLPAREVAEAVRRWPGLAHERIHAAGRRRAYGAVRHRAWGHRVDADRVIGADRPWGVQ